jgi:HEAT repeat protein
MAIIKSKPTSAPAAPTATAHDCAALAQQLSEPTAEARRWAARDMADCPGSALTLVTRLLIEPDVSVREVILTTLTRLGDQQAIPGLVTALRSEEAALRNEVIEALKQWHEAVAPVMRSLLNDADSDLRIFAVNILESLRHPDVETWLREVIESDPHVNVCGTAVDLLGEVGSPAVLDSLQGLKQRFANEPYIQFAAKLAIKRIVES